MFSITKYRLTVIRILYVTSLCYELYDTGNIYGVLIEQDHAGQLNILCYKLFETKLNSLLNVKIINLILFNKQLFITLIFLFNFEYQFLILLDLY